MKSSPEGYSKSLYPNRDEEAGMTRIYFQQVATEVAIVSSSGLFLAWYIWAKLAVFSSVA